MRFRNIVSINAPIGVVFKRFVAPHEMVNWAKGFKGFHATKGKHRKVGSQGVQTYNDDDGILKIQELVQDNIKNELFTVILTHPNMVSTVEHKFVSLDDGRSKIIVNTKVRLKPFFFNLLSPLMRGSMVKRQKEDLLAFKKLVEE